MITASENSEDSLNDDAEDLEDLPAEWKSMFKKYSKPFDCKEHAVSDLENVSESVAEDFVKALSVHIKDMIEVELLSDLRPLLLLREKHKMLLNPEYHEFHGRVINETQRILQYQGAKNIANYIENIFRTNEQIVTLVESVMKSNILQLVYNVVTSEKVNAQFKFRKRQALIEWNQVIGHISEEQLIVYLVNKLNTKINQKETS